jgi:3-oxoacyl-(acyl-carrier-protein) synthase
MDAIGYAANLVADGEVDLVLCGGTEAPLFRFPILELRAAGLTPFTCDMPARASRPFDLWRTTGVVSEGTCMFVIEPEGSSRTGYSYISGYGFANDEADCLCSGLASATRLALASAHLRPSQLEALVLWGPGHREIDHAETKALGRVFGSVPRGIPAMSSKGSLGIALGAASAIDVAVAALAQKMAILPPTVNWEHSDPACPLNLSNRSRAISHDSTLIQSHGLGGVNASMVLERC